MSASASVPVMLSCSEFDNIDMTDFTKLYGLDYPDFTWKTVITLFATKEKQYEEYKNWYLVRYTKLGKALE